MIISRLYLFDYNPEKGEYEYEPFMAYTEYSMTQQLIKITALLRWNKKI